MIQIQVTDIHSVDHAAKQLVTKMGTCKKVAFSGEMGAGKTTLIKAVCRVLGVREMVNSPTFALINEYFTDRGESIFHFDLYRIEEISEMYDLGYEDYFFSDAYCFVEWPEKASELIPDEFLFLHIDVKEDGSRLIRENA
ncbi:MAG: tRNA (adenosine(37)-N6)-threonylcarbamoyltransferase complex ATPase subunit type 1 TsaE [Bacteroidales bacterium]|nr:tRNA (adenosine(37)-N6)-threonylcarbamoyltransferase complex ATPase subunit type 1 TsaE [Bacteroidales bacterium]